MRKTRNVWFILCLVLMLVLTACSSKTQTPAPSDSGQQSSGDAPVTEKVKYVNIGYTGPMSGGGALFGKDVTDGLEMAVEEINAQGLNINGQKYKINLVKLDDQYLPDKAATNARRLVNEYNTPVIFVPHSGGALALQQFNEVDNFLIMAFTGEIKVAQTGNSLSVMCTSPYILLPEVYAQKTMEKHGKKLALIPTTSQYGKDWTEALIAAWEKLGGTIVENVPVDYNTEVDFSTYVSKALAANPDVIFVGGPSQPTAMVIKACRQAGFKGGFIIMDQAKIDQIVNYIPLSDLEGSIGVTPVFLYDSPGALPYVERFKQRYDGKIPTWEATKNYDHMWLLAKGMEKAGSVDDPAKILEGMRAVCPFNDPNIVTIIPGIGEGGASMTPSSAIMIENGDYTKPINIPNPANPNG